MQNDNAWWQDAEPVLESNMAPEEALGIKKPATEETLQSIDSTLKRIETILHLVQNQLSVLADRVPLESK